MGIETKVIRQDDSVRVCVEGDLDISVVPRVDHEIKAAERLEPARIVLDLSRLRFMDSSGLRLIVSTHQRLVAAGRRLQIVNGPPAVRRVFSVTRLDERLEFVDR